MSTSVCNAAITLQRQFHKGDPTEGVIEDKQSEVVILRTKGIQPNRPQACSKVCNDGAAGVQ